MRNGFSFAILAVSLLLGQAQIANADAISTFDASGTFFDGSSLTGTVTIDTTIGSVTAVDLFVGSVELPFIQSVIVSPPGIRAVVHPGGDPALALFIPTGNFVDYTGGPLASLDDFAPGPNPTDFFPSATFGTDVPLVSGSLSLPGVPEPITLSIFGAGLVGAAAMRRRKAKRS